MNIDKNWLIEKIKECEREIEVADELIKQLNSDLLSVTNDRDKMKLALEFNDIHYRQLYKNIVLYLSLTMHCSNSTAKEAHKRRKVDEILESLVAKLNRTVEFIKQTRISMQNEEKNIGN